MLFIQKFTFNPIQENTYILYNDKQQAIIIDPGVYDKNEQTIITKFIDEAKLTPTHLINTHCHIDHIFGNAFIAKRYGLKLEAHKYEIPILALGSASAARWGLNYENSPEIETFLNEGDKINLGTDVIDFILVPGHSPGSIALYCKDQDFCIAGDVLFKESIGRTDLPMGNHNDLLQSIKQKLFTLPNSCIIYAGHGIETSIGYEKKHNPFLQ